MDDRVIEEKTKREASSVLDDILEYVFSEDALSNLVIFKGGTALSKVYGIDRFSKDIDLSYVGPGYGNVVSDIKIYAEGLRLKVISLSSNSIEFKIGALRSSVDVSYLRDVINKNVKTVTVTSERGNRYFVRAMDIDEILAEKIRCIVERREGKDLWDACRILDKGIICSSRQIDYKCVHSNPKFAFDSAEFAGIINSWKEHRYLGQLRDYVDEKDIMPLKEVKEKLVEFIDSV